jgi:hypothetical protein
MRLRLKRHEYNRCDQELRDPSMPGRVPRACGLFPPPENWGKLPHFSTCMRGFCHSLCALFLPVGAGRSGVAVPPAPVGVAKRLHRRVPDDTGAPIPRSKAQP